MARIMDINGVVYEGLDTNIDWANKEPQEDLVNRCQEIIEIIDGSVPYTNEHFSVMTNEAYHALPGLSNSKMKVAAHSLHALKMREKYPNLYGSQETGPQRLGTLEHMALLEPERFEREVKSVSGHRAKTEVRARINDLEAQGFYVCKPDEYELARAIKEEVLETNRTLRDLISNKNALKEISVIHTSGDLIVKCRPDYFITDGKKFVIMDIKTYTDLSDRSLQSQIYRMKYHYQAAWYLQVTGITTGMEGYFLNCFVDTKNLEARIIEIDKESIAVASANLDDLMIKYLDASLSGVFPPMSAGGITEITL